MLGALILLYRQIQLDNIPAAQKRIPYWVEHEEIPVPRRPGTKSIRIVGPPVKRLKFQIDFRRNPAPLDWNRLQLIDMRADVMVEGIIDTEGNFTLRRINDRGHPDAGRYIKSVLNTWKFLQYKTGSIRYYFNVPTSVEHMKVQVDLRGLKKNPKFVQQYDKVVDGMIYYFNGIDNNSITLIY
ncbi:MAG: hypothetical protein ACE5IR_07100 [bacterium]